jgi:putative DNA primase/helicase
MGKIDSHRTTDVRAVLEPIAGFAERHGVAVLGVTHPPKQAQGNAIRSFTGSLAFVAAARIALLATPDPTTEGRRLLLPVKNNIGLKGLGLGYSIIAKEISRGITAPLVVWDDAPVDYTADQALAAHSGALRNGGSLKEAINFLEEPLSQGPIPAKDGEKAAAANGISRRTLERARKGLGVKAEKTAFESGWLWRPPS